MRAAGTLVPSSPQAAAPATMPWLGALTLPASRPTQAGEAPVPRVHAPSKLFAPHPELLHFLVPPPPFGRPPPCVCRQGCP